MNKFKKWLEIFLPNSVEQYYSGLMKIKEISTSINIDIENCTYENIDKAKEKLLLDDNFIRYNNNGNIGTATITNFKKFLFHEKYFSTLNKDEVKWQWTSGTPTNGYNSPFILCEVVKLFKKNNRGLDFNRELLNLEKLIQNRNKFKAEKDASLVLSQDRDVLTQFGQYWKFFKLTDPNSREVELTKLGLQIADEEKTIDDFIEIQIQQITQKTISSEVKSLFLITQLLEYLFQKDPNNDFITNEELINILPFIYLDIYSVKQLSNAVIYFRSKPNSIAENFYSKLSSNEIRFVEQHFLFLYYAEKIFKSSKSEKGYSLNRTSVTITTTEPINDMENNELFDYSNFDIEQFQTKLIKSGLIFSPELIKRFIASLCTKPFVICSGLSGSGKTKLAQAFAQWISADKLQYEIVPVGADWTNREPLLGYPNALDKLDYVIPENGVLDLLIRARNEYDIYLTDETIVPKPYFLILDEMNLSHVERYFADFLSTMESGDAIPLHKIVSVPGEEKINIPQSLKLPKNLFIIGTVNIDETTYMFSPKVLDRANTIEFRLTTEDLEKYIASDIKLNMELLMAQGTNMSNSFMTLALQEIDKNLKPSEEDLKLFFSELKKSGAEFGYRTASEIGRLMYMLKKLGESGDNLLDIAVMQKLLPKLHGSRNKLTKVLPILGGFCLIDNSKIKEDYLDKFVSNSLTEVELKADINIKYKISFEKICRMYKNAVENGFASYAEA
jgi:hypothetical protein